MIAPDQSLPKGYPVEKEKLTVPPDRSRRPRLVALLVVVLALVAGALWFALQLFPSSPQPQPLVAFGTVEADEVLLSPKIAGQLVAIPVQEGSTIQAGEAVAQLDDSLIQLQMRMADTASLLQLQLQDKDYTLRSPTTGVIAHIPMKVGEVAVPGETVVTVSNPAHLKVTVYIPEQNLGTVRVGQAVRVSADPFPNRVFNGAVTSINEQAEFTHGNVQTRADRLNLVFGVQIDVANPDGVRKAGMPVDVTFPTP